MAYNTLKAAIIAAIKNNDNEEITGDILQGILLSIVNSVGSGYNFAGVATPSTNPGTPDGSMFWIGGKGTYTNFGSTITVPAGFLGLFMWDGSSFSRQAIKLSGGDGIFDITDYTGNSYASLYAALVAVPQEMKFGGMTIRFVQSSDNKYVQYRYMGTAVTINEFFEIANWQKVDDIRFSSNDFQCFEKYKSDGSDQDTYTGYKKQSDYYRAFLNLDLYGFDSTIPHKVQYLTRNESTQSGGLYRIDIYAFQNSTWTKVFSQSLYDVETNQNGVNIITWERTYGSIVRKVVATIDYSFIENGSGWIITRDSSDPNYIIKKECFKSEKDFIEFDQLTIESVNLANPSNIQIGKEVRANGYIYDGDTGDAVIGIPVSAGQTITLGGFYLGKSGYYTIQDSSGTPIEGYFNQFPDPQGTQNPLTLMMPANAAMLYFDISTDRSPSEPYAELMVNTGNNLMPYQPYCAKVTEIRGYPLAGDSISRSEINKIENDIQELQEALLDTGGLIANLPVSDGSDIESGYAYINSSTGVVTVKLS